MATRPPENPDYAVLIRRGFDAQAFMATLGATLERVEPGLVEIHAPHDPRLTQQVGTLHAGASTALVDSACGFAALTLAPPGRDVLSVEFKVDLLRPAFGVRYVARGVVLKSGRTLSRTRGELIAVAEDGSEEVAVVMSATMILVDG
jgi:uncharacterized protein (TIGR00369 family)